MGIKPLPHEDVAAFARRAGRVVSNTQRARGAWSVRWAERCITWAAHILRNNHMCSWGANILDVRSTNEIAARRAFNSNRPATRAQPGFACRRWTDGVHAALDFWQAPNKGARRYVTSVSNHDYFAVRKERISAHVSFVQEHLHKL